MGLPCSADGSRQDASVTETRQKDKAAIAGTLTASPELTRQGATTPGRASS